MDLRTFIRETLCQISDGMIDAQEALRGKGVQINPPHSISNGNFEPQKPNEYKPHGDNYQAIEFDIALTAAEGAQTEGGFSIAVVMAKLSAGGGREEINSSVSRVRFRLPALLPQYTSEDK